MSLSKKYIKNIKYGFVSPKKKAIVNNLRFVFNAINAKNGSEQIFALELCFLNSKLATDEPVLGFKTRLAISAEDLQYALAGTDSARNLKTETLMQPSFCCISCQKFGEDAKQISYYCSTKDVKVNSRHFEICANVNKFTDEALTGNIHVSTAQKEEHPEYLCDVGSAKWNLTYEIENQSFTDNGYDSKTVSWSPFGILAHFSGKISFDDVEYVVDPRRSYGFIESFRGTNYQNEWFHLSSANLASLITGKNLFNSAFALQGNLDNKLSFLANFDNIEIDILADSAKRKYSSIWDCVQVPEVDEDGEACLHWSVSLHSKIWVIDIDIYCKIKELYNKKYEAPEGNRTVLSVLQGATGSGELKLYKKNKKVLEQIEDAKIEKVFCEFGHIEEAEN